CTTLVVLHATKVACNTTEPPGRRAPTAERKHPEQREHARWAARDTTGGEHPPMLKTSLRTRFPEIAAEWHPTKNGALGPGDVAASSGRRVFWRCRVCAHVWGTSPHHRTYRGHGCPACAGRVASPTTSLRARFPVLALEWHPT